MPKVFLQPGQLKVGREYPPKDELRYTEEMIGNIKAQLIKMYTSGEMQRQAHPKMHGCVKAEFTIETDLPPELRIGLFKAPKTYPAWIRFSNANTKPQPDIKKDVRGMAIKLVGVEGQKLLNNERDAATHDFLLISHKTFLAKNVGQFHKTIKAITGDKISLISYFLTHPAFLLRTMQSFKHCTNVLETAYFSTTPYQFGSENRAVKYFVSPANNRKLGSETTGDDYLKANLIKALNMQDVYFDFYVQFQEDAYKTPVEDATVEWKTDFRKVASIKVPIQQFDSDDQFSFGQNLSFTPWHCLPEHRPLGGLNRARKNVYEATAEFRLHQNGVANVEPDVSSFEKFKTKNMESQTNEQVVKQMFQNFLSKNIPGVIATFSTDITWLEPGAPDVPFGGTYQGLTGIQEMFERETAVTVTSFEPKKYFSNDNMVVVLGSDSAIVNATKKNYSTDWTMAFTLAESKITNVQVYMDTNAIAKAFLP